MRYSELFSIKTNITILGNYGLRAGDMVQATFPDLQEKRSRSPNAQTSGKYMIGSLCHRLTVSDCHSSLTLLRDSLPPLKKVLPDNRVPGGPGPIVGFRP